MKKEQILKAALQLLAVRGLHAITFADIAKEANVGIGTIYRYFSGKEDLIIQVWIEQKKREAEYVFKGYKINGTIRQRFNFLCGRVITYLSERPLEFQFSYHFASSPILGKSVHKLAMKEFLPMDKLYEDGLTQDIFKPMKPQHLRLFTLGTINGWLLWSLAEKPSFNNKTRQQFLQMIWDALAK